jgi:hypothetical protein
MPENSLLHRPAIDGVRQQFEAWRQIRKKRTPIPSALWEAAVCLCENHSVNQVARALHLSHAELKARVGQRNQNVNTPPAFMELPLIPLPAPECAVEMENRHGERLLMQFKGNVSLDLLELGRSFWRRAP